jgi:DNA repair exonuclease SbcCD ATPase subunit
LALGDLVNTRARNTVDLLVVDEIVDGLDPVGIERLLQVFAQMTETRSSIWCISHNQRLAAHFPTVVNVVQEHGVSRIWDPN